MSTLKNGEFGIDLDKEKILWTDRKRHTIFSLPLSFTKRRPGKPTVSTVG